MAQTIMYDNIPFSGDTTLVEQINSAATTIEVADGSVFPAAPNYATIGTDVNAETIFYGAKSGNILSGIVRGVEGTPRTWTAGEMIARNFTNKDLVTIKDNIRDLANSIPEDLADLDEDATHRLVTDVEKAAWNAKQAALSGDVSGHHHTSDRNRANHSGSQLASTISDFTAAVLVAVITGLSTATNAAIAATDTVLVALGKLQAQINARKALALKDSVGTAEIDNAAVTSAKLADMAAYTVKGRNAADTGVPSDVTMLDVAEYALHQGTATTAPADTEFVPLNVSATSLKKISWANVKAALKTYFDAFYFPAISALTALPTSGTALTNNAEYRVASAVGTYIFAWPSSPFEVWLKFTTAATFNITFPAGTTYIGGAPTFAASKTYEMSVKDGVVIVQEVAA